MIIVVVFLMDFFNDGVYDGNYVFLGSILIGLVKYYVINFDIDGDGVLFFVEFVVLFVEIVSIGVVLVKIEKIVYVVVMIFVG